MTQPAAPLAPFEPNPLVPGTLYTGRSQLAASLDAGGGREVLAGALLAPIVVGDEGDSWGAGIGRYRDDAGRFGAALLGVNRQHRLAD